MKTQLAMKQQSLRYFSSLTPTQKDTTVFMLVKIKLGLIELPKGLASIIMLEIQEELINTRKLIEQKIRKQKCFKHNDVYYPLNIQELIK